MHVGFNNECLADHVWSMEEIAALSAPVAHAKRGPYKKREAA
jgi:hypothetical protein